MSYVVIQCKTPPWACQARLRARIVSRLAIPIEKSSSLLKNPVAWAWISAPFFALLAIWIGLSHGPWIVLLAAIALAWALLVWLVLLPSWQNRQPFAQKFKPRVDPSHAPLALLTSVGWVRLPLDRGVL